MGTLGPNDSPVHENGPHLVTLVVYYFILLKFAKIKNSVRPQMYLKKPGSIPGSFGANQIIMDYQIPLTVSHKKAT